MSKELNCKILSEFKNLYASGYRCINYEIDEKDNLFTVYLKDFDKEEIKTLKCNIDKGKTLKNYIDRLS